MGGRNRVAKKTKPKAGQSRATKKSPRRDGRSKPASAAARPGKPASSGKDASSESPATKKRASSSRRTTRVAASAPVEAERTPANRNNRIRPANKESLNATSQDPIQFPEEQRKLPKTPLTAKELREFRQLLLEKRAELFGDVERLTSEALNTDGNGGEQSNMPIHMADLGSDNWEREFTLGLIASERAIVREIDDALDRIENKTYGICLGTLQPIDRARLRAKPWAKYCIEYARAREEGRVP